MAATSTPSLLSQLFALLLKDEQTAILPDVLALFQYVSTNGVTMIGMAFLNKALVAVEADAIGGAQQFAKDAAAVILAYIQQATAPAAPAAPAPAKAA